MWTPQSSDAHVEMQTRMHACTHTDSITLHRQWWRNPVYCHSRTGFQGLLSMRNLSPLARATKIFYLLPSSSYFLARESCVTQVYWVYWTLALSWWFLLTFHSAFWYGLYFHWCSPAWDLWRCCQRWHWCLKSDVFPRFLPNLTAVELPTQKLQNMFSQAHCPSEQPSRSWEQPQSTPQKTDTTRCNWLEQWTQPYHAPVVRLGEL